MKIPIHLSSSQIKNIPLSGQLWPEATSGNKDGLETELHVLSTQTQEHWEHKEWTSCPSAFLGPSLRTKAIGQEEDALTG